MIGIGGCLFSDIPQSFYNDGNFGDNLCMPDNIYGNR